MIQYSILYNIQFFVISPIGLFCSPIVHQKVDEPLKSQLIPHKYDVISLSVKEFVDLLVNSSNVGEALQNQLKKQYAR